MRKLRIALVAPQPFGETRGTPMANRRLVQVLSEAGHAVDVFTYPYGTCPVYPGVTMHRCRPVPGIKSVGIGFSPAKFLTDLSLAWSALRQIRGRKYDCIQGVEEGVFIALLLGGITRTPVVYDMDSIMSHDLAACRFGRVPGVTRLMRAAEHWAIRRSDFVMTICDAMADYARQADPGKETAVVPDIPLAAQDGGANPDRAREQLPDTLFEGRKVVMYTGSFATYQGLDLLISAMPTVISRHPEAALVVVGGDDKSIARLTELGNALEVMSHILFVGKRPPEEVPDFLSIADVLVSPRRSGINPPAKMYTYMQSGRPTVATSIPAHEAMLSEESAVMVEPSPESIAEGIRWALEHPEEAEERARRAQAIVARLTPEYQAERILEAYRSLCGDAQSLAA